MKEWMCGVYNPASVVKRQIAMEDVGSIALEAFELVERRLGEFGVELKPGQDDEVFVPLKDALERLAGYPDYRSHN